MTSATLLDWFGGAKGKAGISVTEKSAVKFIAVYRAVALVSGAIASLPLEAHRLGPERTLFRSMLLERPHPDMTSMELWETTLAHLLLWGNAYLDLSRSELGTIQWLEPINPGAVTAKRVTKTAANPAGKQFTIRYDNGQSKDFTPFEILHIPGPGYDGVSGLSPIGAARQGIELGLAAEQYGARLFGSGSLMSGILQTDQTLDETSARALKTRWTEKVSGLEHAHEVAVLDSGAKFQSMSIPPEDAQFIESRKFQVTEIARLYGIPPHLLGDVEVSSSWGTGIEQQSIGFVVYTLMPWLTRMQQRLSDRLLPRGVTCHFHTDQLTLGDAKTRAEADQILIQNGVKSFNQSRENQGMPPRPGGDSYMIPANMMILGDDGLPVKQPAPVAPALPQGVPPNG